MVHSETYKYEYVRDPGHLAAVNQVDFVPKPDQTIITALSQLQNEN